MPCLSRWCAPSQFGTGNRIATQGAPLKRAAGHRPRNGPPRIDSRAAGSIKCYFISHIDIKPRPEKPMPRRRFLATLGTLPLILGGVARAQPAFPTRPIRIVVPFDPGSTADVVTRFVVEAMQPSVPQPIVVDNKAGASAIIGSTEVARARPDGHTLLLVSSTQPASMAMFRTLPYDLLTDLVPVSRVIGGPMVVVASPHSGIRSVAQLVERMRRQAESVTFSSGGVGTPTFMALERFQAEAGGRLLHVPFRASAAGFNAVIAGQVDVVAGGFAISREHIQRGTLVPLAVTTATRNALYPDVPTFRELGFNDMTISTWWGFVAPKGTPQEAIDFLAARFDEAARSRALRERVEPLGYVLDGSSTPAAYGAFLREEVESGRTIMQRIGYQPQ
jgi:tripartite-type tricarboxylate transporter receptor subunit TctC